MRSTRSTLATVAALALAGSLGAAGAVPSASAVPQSSPSVVRTADPRADVLIAKARAVLGSQADARVRALDSTLGTDAETLRARLATAINPADYQCAPTEFDTWVEAQLASFTDEDMLVLLVTQALVVPAYDALFFGNASDPNYALTSDAKAMGKTFRTLKKFWDTRGDDIALLGLHGSTLLDQARVSRTYQVIFEVPKAEADELAGLLADYLKDPKFQGGNHPIFTLNAFAFTAVGKELPPGAGTPSDRIIMGDGILRAYRDMGYADVAPQTVLAHEYAHHVQFETGMIPPGVESGPEETRRTEMHADASSAYYLSHPRGESMQWKRVSQFVPIFYGIGDCWFDDPGHHGTPNQRRAAGEWGYSLQENARPKGHILPAREFQRLFDAALPTLVAPDA